MRRHDLDGVSLLFGLLFTGVGLLLLGGDPAGGSVSLAWAGPVAAIGVGLLIVLAVRPHRSKVRNEEAEQAATDLKAGIRSTRGGDTS